MDVRNVIIRFWSVRVLYLDFFLIYKKRNIFFFNFLRKIVFFCILFIILFWFFCKYEYEIIIKISIIKIERGE